MIYKRLYKYNVVRLDTESYCVYPEIVNVKILFINFFQSKLFLKSRIYSTV